MKSDSRRVMRARPSLFCYVHTILARPDIGANAYCHLIGRDDEMMKTFCHHVLTNQMTLYICCDTCAIEENKTTKMAVHASFFPAILGKGPWPKLEKND